MSFVDKVDVTFKAGDGGDGNVSFRHQKFKPMGGPDGGDGGKGGNIVLVASRNQNTLAAFRYKKLIKAANGKTGGTSNKHGRSADDLEVAVPLGTVVMRDGEVLADLANDDQSAIIAKGGSGGFGNAHFTSSTRQAPRVAEKGEAGENFDASLELKMIADVGLVGLPNAGKSTLLSVISNARPEIADYPFTTLQPNLGVVDIDQKHSLLIADIPGLIEGASQGKGLGDDFLRHIERTKVIVHLIDAYNQDIVGAYQTIIKELHDYKDDLAARRQVVAITKTEGLSDKEIDELIALLRKVVPKATQIIAISSQSGKNLKELLRLVLTEVTNAAKHQPKTKVEDLPVIGLKENDDDWQVKKTKTKFIVKGLKIERFAGRTKFGEFYSEQRLRDIMRRQGIMRELEKKGIEPGQNIQIGDPLIGKIEY